jgi:hypothetical protein
MNAFAAASAALFRDPNLGSDAVWRAGGDGPAMLVRAILRAPDRENNWSDTRVVSDAVSVQLTTLQVPDLRGGDTVEVGGRLLLIRGEPVRDALRLVWTAEAVPA